MDPELLSESGSRTHKIQSWIRIRNKSFRIHNTSVSDLYSLNPDPAKNLNPDPDPDPGKFFSPTKNLLEIEEKKNVVHKTIKKIKLRLNPYP